EPAAGLDGLIHAQAPADAADRAQRIQALDSLLLLHRAALGVLGHRQLGEARLGLGHGPGTQQQRGNQITMHPHLTVSGSTGRTGSAGPRPAGWAAPAGRAARPVAPRWRPASAADAAGR